MKVTIQKTEASLERRLELQSKIWALLQEYDNVPILIAQKLIFECSKAEAKRGCLNFEGEKQAHLFVEDHFIARLR